MERSPHILLTELVQEQGSQYYQWQDRIIPGARESRKSEAVIFTMDQREHRSCDVEHHFPLVVTVQGFDKQRNEPVNRRYLANRTTL